MKPIIGVLPLWDEEKDSLWMLPGYFDAIEEAGGIPIMLPLTDDQDALETCARMCHGFLFTGGQDVSPSVYNAEVLFNNVEPAKARDDMECILMDLALSMDKPVLGICRGLQFLNAYLGGTLYQHHPAEHPSAINHQQKAPYDIPVHKNLLIPGTPLHTLLGKEELAVNSCHHQAVKDLAPSLTLMSTSEDGLIEGAYMKDKTFVWAVQWHPEFSHKVDEDSRKIFAAFLKAAADTM